MFSFKNDVLKLKRNGVIKAVGEGKKTVKGYIVPADNETILAEGGAASVDNYSCMPSAVIVPVQATVQVGGEKQSHATPTPTPKPTTSPTANPQISKKKVFKKGDIFSDSKSNGKYKVTKSNAGKYEISFVKYTGKSKKTVTIPNSIKKNGTRYTVTGIGAKAFYGCKKLKTIQIKSQKLKTIGNKALYGINKKAVIGIPKRKRKKYIKLFSRKTGFRKTMKFKNL